MKIKFITILFSTLLLSACLYPDNQRVENTPTNDEQLQKVQEAVLKYKNMNNGLLPIKTRDMSTPIFIKYPIDFGKLNDANILGQPPANSFESGGAYSYVIVDPENKTQVKVSDVRVNQKLRQINYDIRLYRNKHTYPPFGERLSRNYFKIDYKKLNRDQPFTVNSPYSNLSLEVIINAQGQIFVDYRPDVYQLLESKEITNFNGDLRFLLIEYYPIVPAYSPPMYLKDGKVEFLDDQENINE